MVFPVSWENTPNLTPSLSWKWLNFLEEVQDRYLNVYVVYIQMKLDVSNSHDRYQHNLKEYDSKTKLQMY